MEHFVEVALSKNPKTGRQVVTAAVVKALVQVGFFNCWMRPWEAMDEYQRLVNEIAEKNYWASIEDFNADVDKYKLEVKNNAEAVKPKRPAKPKKVTGRDYGMARTDEIYWITLMNTVYGCQVAPWKKLLPFSPEVESFYQEDLTNLRDGASLFIGGEVVDIIMKRTKKGETYATLRIVDGAESYWVKAWPTWWGDIELDKQRTRPRVGDIVEMVISKKSWNDRPDLSIGGQGSYCRIVARPSQEKT